MIRSPAASARTRLSLTEYRGLPNGRMFQVAMHPPMWFRSSVRFGSKADILPEWSARGGATRRCTGNLSGGLYHGPANVIMMILTEEVPMTNFTLKVNGT